MRRSEKRAKLEDELSGGRKEPVRRPGGWNRGPRGLRRGSGRAGAQGAGSVIVFPEGFKKRSDRVGFHVLKHRSWLLDGER